MRPTVGKLLLICGILAATLYAAMLVIVPMQWEGYSSASQAVSELSAIGAPTRALWVPLGVIWGLLYAAFGWAVWTAAQGKGPLRVAGALIITQSLIGAYWPPMHMRGAEFTLTDALHIVWSVVTVLLMALAIGFAAAAMGKRFRLYSIATLAIFVVFGALTGMDGPRLAANLPTPWLGVWERINIGVWLLWIFVLATTLLRRVRWAGAIGPVLVPGRPADRPTEWAESPTRVRRGKVVL